MTRLNDVERVRSIHVALKLTRTQDIGADENYSVTSQLKCGNPSSSLAACTKSDGLNVTQRDHMEQMEPFKSN